MYIFSTSAFVITPTVFHLINALGHYTFEKREEGTECIRMKFSAQYLKKKKKQILGSKKHSSFSCRRSIIISISYLELAVQPGVFWVLGPFLDCYSQSDLSQLGRPFENYQQVCGKCLRKSYSHCIPMIQPNGCTSM